jgi:subtilase family serine protease
MANLRSLPLFALASAMLFSTASIAQQAAPNVRIVNLIDESQLVTLKGTVHPLANAANDRGAAPDEMPLGRVFLAMKRSSTQESSLRQLITQMHTPGSPAYHQWLTPDQFGAQFGPSDQDIAAVENWLTGHGFSITKVNAGKQTIEISGNVAQMRSAFHTQIHKYEVKGETHYANSTDPQIPAALAPVVGGFTSLNNFRLKSYSKVLGKAEYNPKTGTAKPEWTIGPGSPAVENNFVLAPADYAVQYDLQKLYGNSVTGSGQSIAIVNESNINVDLVNQFRTLFGLSANPPQVIIDGNDPGVDGINNYDGPNYASVEAYLDVEWSGAVAPNATINLVIAADTALSSGLQMAAMHAVYSNISPVISLSFGSCEAGMGSFNQTIESLWEQAAAQGITVVTSTGDSGSAGCDDPNTEDYAASGQAVSGWASTPFNVAVGGTDFYYSQYAGSEAALDTQLAQYWNTTPSNSSPSLSIKGVIPEQPWNNSQYGDDIITYYQDETGGTNTSIAAGGGGASNAAVCSTNDYNSNTGLCTGTLSGYPKPAWQSTSITGVPNDNVRDLPDVSLFAATEQNLSYYPECSGDGDCQPASAGDIAQITGVGGTSASAPSFAGIMALVNQEYGRQGQADFVLYPLSKQFPTAFNDVKNGTNTVPCGYSPLTPNCISVGVNALIVNGVTEGEIGTGTTAEYNATMGYDLASGLGTIDAYNLVTNWNKVTFTHPATTLTANPTTLTHGTGNAIAISGTVTGSTPTGDVALMTDSTEQSQQGEAFFTLSNGAYSSTSASSKAGYPNGINFLPGGTYHIWAQYGGDANNYASTSAKQLITVSPETSAIDMNIIASGLGYLYNSTSGPGSDVDYGTQLLLSAAVGPSSQSAALESCLTNAGSCALATYTSPTGVVTFKDGATVINTAALNIDGEAEYNAPFAVSAGQHSVTASYAGDASYNAATTTTPITFTVVKDTPAIGWGASNTTAAGDIITGQPTVFTVTVENGAQYNAAQSVAVAPVAVLPPTGSVVLSSTPAGISGTVTLSAGVDPQTLGKIGVGAIPLPASLSANTYTVTANYSGDANYEGGTTTLPQITVEAAGGTASTTTATMSGSISPNTTVLISGTVTGQTGHAAPTGDIIFFSSGNSLGAVVIIPGTGDSSTYAAELSSQILFQGTNILTLQYTGDSTYAPSAFTLTNPIANPLSDFSMVPETTIVPIDAGTSTTGTVIINLASNNGFAGTVSMSCSAASPLTCSLTSNPVLTSGGSASATLTVTAPAGTANNTYNVAVTGKDATGEYVHTLGFQAVVTGAAAATPSFLLSNSGSISIAANATTGNTATITATPSGGFTGDVTLTCAVTPTTGTDVPTCSFSQSPVDITGTAAVQSILTVATQSGTTGGAYTVTVTGISGSITQTTPVTVNVTGTSSSPGVTLSNSAGIDVSPGATTGNTSTVTVTPSGGFSGPVNLTCSFASNASTDPATCALASTSVTISGAIAQTDVLTVTTTPASSSKNEPMKLFWPTSGGTVLALAFFFGIPKRRRNWLTMLGLLVFIAAVAGIGCGGGVNSGGGTNPGNLGTTPGTYTITINGTASNVVITPISVSVTVE